MPSEILTKQVTTLSVVTFCLGDEECAIPITDVHQIIRDIPITRVPNVDRHVEGVLNLRGVVAPIIDLKHWLGLGVRKISDQHRIVIVELDGRLVGFSVDAVQGVFNFEESDIQASPDVVRAKIGYEFVKGIVNRGGSIVLLLDLPEVLKTATASLDGRSRWSDAMTPATTTAKAGALVPETA